MITAVYMIKAYASGNAFAGFGYPKHQFKKTNSYMGQKMKQKKHGNIGNQHASKIDAKTAYIQMRVSIADKKAWQDRAKKEGLTLTEWITKRIEKSTG